MVHTDVPIPEGFDLLPPEERVLYVESLWERITRSDEEIPIPESHLRLIENRWREHLADPDSAIPMADALRMIDERLAKRTE